MVIVPPHNQTCGLHTKSSIASVQPKPYKWPPNSKPCRGPLRARSRSSCCVTGHGPDCEGAATRVSLLAQSRIVP